MPGLWKIDFHTHTSFSKDSLTLPENLVSTCRCVLDRVVITDHNSIGGALAVYALNPDLVIIGEEIMTTRGEILAAYVTDEVKPWLSPRETIKRLRDQGALISVAHPFDTWRSGHWELDDLLEIAPLVDAIEVFNARCMRPGANRMAMEFAREHNLPGTAGSDAHAAFEVGRARLVLPQFDGADGLRSVIRQGRIEGRMSLFWVHFASRYARLRKKVGV
jgi:hypothetical protein